MIGIIADSADHDVIREFFELFKIPWEFRDASRRYEVLICAGNVQCEADATLIVFYAGKKTSFDDQRDVAIGNEHSGRRLLSYDTTHIPVYGDTVSFLEAEGSFLRDKESKEPAAYLKQAEGRTVARIGYDLFNEVRTLLTEGQPAANASIPALELHIALLRGLIIDSGISLTEIPPVPEGFRFIACLTHDVDHPLMREHKCDHTMFGFLYRAIAGSLFKFIGGDISFRDLLANWAAALKLPLVFAGLAKDYWADFGNRYVNLERPFHSTFFVLPFRNRVGRTPQGTAPGIRAARYGAQDIADTIRTLTVQGCEVGLHGIDAWCDSAKAREELEEIRRLTGNGAVGVRMHWLYFDQNSPAILDSAGAAYDSTIGYNDTVGYRAGTMQAYKPLNSRRLLELPLHVMDTALFYPSYLNLSQSEASVILGRMAADAVKYGGVLTVNWHDRSIAPERLWGTAYSCLIAELQKRGAWFATASEAASWFSKRRSTRFERDGTTVNTAQEKLHSGSQTGLPGLRLRSYNVARNGEASSERLAGYIDIKIEECNQSRIPTEARP